MFGQYSFGEAVHNGICLVYTKVRFRTARLIRLPFYLRNNGGHFSYGSGLTVGYSCRFDIGEGAYLSLGKNCKLNDRVHLVAHQSLTIGDNALFASNIFVTDTSHGDFSSDNTDPSIAPGDRPLVSAPTSIGNNVWVGEGVCILPGVTIGDGCTIGANAVVTKSFPANTVIAGVPARALKSWDSNKRAWGVV